MSSNACVLRRGVVAASQQLAEAACFNFEFEKLVRQPRCAARDKSSQQYRDIGAART